MVTCLPPSARISIPEGVLVRDLDGESVVLNVHTEQYFGLDGVGTRMWAALAVSGSIDAACQSLVDEFEVDPAHLRADLEALVGELVDHGLLTVHE